MLLLREDEVRALLPMGDAVERMRDVFAALARGQGINQPRRRLVLGTGSVLHALAGSWGNYFGTKVYATHLKHGAHFHCLLYDAGTARPLALLEANWLGQIRTGAVTGLATDLLASPSAAVLGVIGAGFQAASQVEAILAVRPISWIRVYSRTEQRVLRFAEECSRRFSVPVDPVPSAEAAVKDADIVVTATNAKYPVIESAWLRPECHINAVGSNVANRREIPEDIVRQAAMLVVDSVEQARIESGDLLLALEPGDWNRVLELKDCVENPARRTSGGRTLFKSNGLGIEDIAAAALVYERAMERGMGQTL